MFVSNPDQFIALFASAVIGLSNKFHRALTTLYLYNAVVTLPSSPCPDMAAIGR